MTMDKPLALAISVVISIWYFNGCLGSHVVTQPLQYRPEEGERGRYLYTRSSDFKVVHCYYCPEDAFESNAKSEQYLVQECAEKNWEQLDEYEEKNGKNPLCNDGEKITCPPLPEIMNGGWLIPYDMSPDSVMVYYNVQPYCQEGYKLVHNSSIEYRCNEKRQWSTNVSIPLCIQVPKDLSTVQDSEKHDAKISEIIIVCVAVFLVLLLIAIVGCITLNRYWNKICGFLKKSGTNSTLQHQNIELPEILAYRYNNSHHEDGSSGETYLLVTRSGGIDTLARDESADTDRQFTEADSLLTRSGSASTAHSYLQRNDRDSSGIESDHQPSISDIGDTLSMLDKNLSSGRMISGLSPDTYSERSATEQQERTGVSGQSVSLDTGQYTGKSQESDLEDVAPKLSEQPEVPGKSVSLDIGQSTGDTLSMLNENLSSGRTISGLSPDTYSERSAPEQGERPGVPGQSVSLDTGQYTGTSQESDLEDVAPKLTEQPEVPEVSGSQNLEQNTWNGKGADDAASKDMSIKIFPSKIKRSKERLEFLVQKGNNIYIATNNIKQGEILKIQTPGKQYRGQFENYFMQQIKDVSFEDSGQYRWSVESNSPRPVKQQGSFVLRVVEKGEEDETSFIHRTTSRLLKGLEPDKCSWNISEIDKCKIKHVQAIYYRLDTDDNWYQLAIELLPDEDVAKFDCLKYKHQKIGPYGINDGPTEYIFKECFVPRGMNIGHVVKGLLESNIGQVVIKDMLTLDIFRYHYGFCDNCHSAVKEFCMNDITPLSDVTKMLRGESDHEGEEEKMQQ